MNRDQVKAFIADLKKMRAAAQDEVAIEAPCVYPQWSADVAYNVGDRVLYNEILYKVLIAHTSQSDWLPIDAPALFAKVLTDEISGKVLPWEQPESTNPYMKGDKVTHNGNTWMSTIDGNVWEPGVYGWEIVTE
jgi:chitodextrinase